MMVHRHMVELPPVQVKITAIKYNTIEFNLSLATSNGVDSSFWKINIRYETLDMKHLTCIKYWSYGGDMQDQQKHVFVNIFSFLPSR